MKGSGLDTPEGLRKVIESGIESNLRFRDPDYHFMLDQLWTVMFETTTALRRSTDALKPSELPEKDFTCLIILTNCLVDAHASYQSLRAGFHRAAAITARGLLENLALSVAIKADESNAVFNRYKSDEYDIPKAVSLASKQFSFIGKIYGVLSNKFAHEPYESIGRAFIHADGKTTLLLVPPVSRNEFLVQFVLLVNLGLLVGILGQTIEWTFANRVKPTIFWELVDDQNIKLIDNESKRANLAMADKLSQLLAVRKTPSSSV
jgi:hypothetical protein